MFATRPMVVVGERETAVSVPGVGVIFVSDCEGTIVIEASAFGGPGVADRKSHLEGMLRAAGLGHVVDEARRRAEVAS
jgi:hypothetical protein